MIIDTNKTGFENFLTLISKAANRVFDSKYLNFTFPQPFAHPSYPAVNSVVQASAKPKGPYKGNTTFIYTRINLGTAMPPVEITYEDGFDYLLFKRNLINALGLIYADVDFDVQSVPVPEIGESAFFHIVAKPTSYVYSGKLRINVVSGVPDNARLLEDGSLRLMEDGTVRILEE